MFSNIRAWGGFGALKFEGCAHFNSVDYQSFRESQVFPEVEKAWDGRPSEEISSAQATLSLLAGPTEAADVLHHYDERGRILEKEQFGEEPEAHQLFSYRYDPLGRLDRVILRSAQEGERVFESVLYAADGTKTETFYPTPLDDTKRKTTGVCAESMLHLSIDAVVIMTVLDANDRPIRKVLYDDDDRVIRRVAFRYDACGMLLEEVSADDLPF